MKRNQKKKTLYINKNISQPENKIYIQLAEPKERKN